MLERNKTRAEFILNFVFQTFFLLGLTNSTINSLQDTIPSWFKSNWCIVIRMIRSSTSSLGLNKIFLISLTLKLRQFSFLAKKIFLICSALDGFTNTVAYEIDTSEKNDVEDEEFIVHYVPWQEAFPS